MNPIQALTAHGQSIWLDYIRRGMTRSGELKRMIEDTGILGMTSNPAIFQKSIGSGNDYQGVLAELGADPTLDAKGLYERIAITDIQEACDVMRPLYQRCDRRDGFVSLEVSPSLANDAEGTIAEAKRLWAAVERPNLMIKVPATQAGLIAIEALIGEGINVNVTLIFSQKRYQEVATAYMRGLQRRADDGASIEYVASVASFFVSRIDSAVDGRLTELAESHDTKRSELARGLLGKIAIANAKVAYALYEDLLETAQWRALAERGARPQRLLWASTGTKNPDYRDTLYVEELIGANTVNTVPPATLEAFVDHGQARPSLTENVDEARAALEQLDALGISLDAITDDLLEVGLKLFADAMDSLLLTVAEQQRLAQGART